MDRRYGIKNGFLRAGMEGPKAGLLLCKDLFLIKQWPYYSWKAGIQTDKVDLPSGARSPPLAVRTCATGLIIAKAVGYLVAVVTALDERATSESAECHRTAPE